MRKSPTFNNPIICKRCGKTFMPTGTRQLYCGECKPIVKKETKSKWYVQSNPNAYAVKEKKVCSVCGDKFSSSINGIPYCNKHYLRMKNNGTTEKITRKSKNVYSFIDDYVELRTTKGESFLIDKCDLDKTLNYTWCVSKTGYLVANINHKVIKLHRYLLGLTTDKVIDHINGNTLDNRRNNLRICSVSENGKNIKLKNTNSSGYQGVRKTNHNTFNVRITVDNKEIHIGNFKTFEEAVQARIDAELKYYGEYSPSLRK